MGGDLTHDDIRDAFIAVVNVLEPDHYDLEDPYPIERENVRYGYHKSSSSTYASCGPRKSILTSVSFSADKRAFNEHCDERCLAILVHEATHLTEGSFTDSGGGHPPAFWREFGFNVHIALDNWQEIQEGTFAEMDKEKFVGEVVQKEVDGYNLDLRYYDVVEARHMVAKWFKNTLKNTG